MIWQWCTWTGSEQGWVLGSGVRGQIIVIIIIINLIIILPPLSQVKRPFSILNQCRRAVGDETSAAARRDGRPLPPRTKIKRCCALSRSPWTNSATMASARTAGRCGLPCATGRVRTCALIKGIESVKSAEWHIRCRGGTVPSYARTPGPRRRRPPVRC